MIILDISSVFMQFSPNSSLISTVISVNHKLFDTITLLLLSFGCFVISEFPLALAKSYWLRYFIYIFLCSFCLNH